MRRMPAVNATKAEEPLARAVPPWKGFAIRWTQTLRSREVRPSATALGLSLALALCSSAFAQSGESSIKGTVADPTGAVIPGASVHVSSSATGIAIDTKTNSAGFYQVPGLNTGTYVVSVTAPGMATTNQTIELQAGQNAVINPSMTTGEVTQQVTVSGNTVQMITTDNGAITSTLENARISELPMNGRSMVTLLNETTPGIENGPHSNASANGQEGAATEYVVDGTSLANLEFGGVYSGAFAVAHSVDPDAVQEVHVENSVSPAQYSAPMTVVLTTKAGTNAYHGTLFETAANSAFGIARSRSNQSNYAEPQYIRNEFGASVGGPIVIPHLYDGKNKSFFFFAYERYSLAQHATYNMTVPTLAMRNGDFSGLANSSNVLQQLYNPYTTNPTGSAACQEPTSAGTASPVQRWCRAPFVNNQIPTSLQSPTAAILNQMTPLPTNANNPLVSSNLSYAFPEVLIDPQFSLRLDHVFNENNRAYLRYTQNTNSNVNPHSTSAAYTLPVPSVGIPAGLSGESFTTNGTYAAAIGFTHVFSPTFYSETVVGDTWMSERDLAGGNPNFNWEAKLGVPNNFGENGFPAFASLFQPINGTQYAFTMVWSIPTFDENLTKTLGKHQMQFGGRYRLERIGELPDQNADTIGFGNGLDTGLYNPSTGSQPAAYSNTGNLNADEFLGGASSYSVNLEPPYQNMHGMEFDGYFQDNYRMRSNLTVNLGLRWEAHPAMFMARGMMMGFDLKNDAVVTSGSLSQLISEGVTTQAIITNDELDGVKFETPAQAGLPSMLVRNYDFTFSPRVGAAWQPFGDHPGTVFRGGVGRYIYPPPIRETYRAISRNNPFAVGYSNSYTSAGYAPDNLQNYMLRSQPNTSSSYSYLNTAPGGTGGTAVLGVNSTNVVNTSSTTAITPGLGLSTLNPDFPPDYVDEANFTIEQPLKWNSVLRVSYVYTHGTNLNNSFYYNDHPSNYSWEVQTGMIPPAGTASVVSANNVNTGEGPYDNLTYGSGNNLIQKSGWSNYNALQANFQKLYHNGSAWQLMGVWSKSMRTGGDFGGSAGDQVDPYSSYVNSGPASVSVAPEGGTLIAPNLPPPPPAGFQRWQYYKALNRWENYMIDTNNPWLHIQFNGRIDLPFGTGKRWLGTSGRALNEVVGGWQIAGDGNVTGEEFAINSGNWGPTSQLQVYKHHAITDCRSGTCLKSIEWFNGYIAPTAVAGNTCSTGLPNVSGLPAGWAPYQTPIDTICGAPSGGKAVVDKYFGANDVIMNGVTGQTANTVLPYGDVPGNNDNGVSGGGINVTNPFGHVILNGPFNHSIDLSLFKNFPITEGMNLRVYMDAFNAFNIQGFGNPSGTDGTVCVSPGGVGCSSYNAPRQIQISARLTF